MYKTLCAPLSAQIEITSLCNNECLHCYNFWRKDRKLTTGCENMSTDEIRLILRKFSDAKIFAITITGGEPLLNKEGLIVCLEEANRLNIEASVNSNLVLLDEKYLQDLKKLGIKTFLVSILGPNAEIHDGITRRKGSFDALINNICLCMRNHVRISPNMVITQKNIMYLRQTAELIHSLGVNNFFSTRAGCPGNCNDFSDLSISLEQFRQYLEELYRVNTELGMKTDVLESYPLCGIKEFDRYKNFTGRKCLAGVTTFTIASNGDVRPCSHLDVSYGNIFTEEIDVIWEKMEGWRNGSFLPADCKQCKLLIACGGGCRMEAKTMNKSFTNLDPYASPKDVDYCFGVMMENRNKTKALNNGKMSYTGFVLKNIPKWREEFFGSIVVINRKSCVYFDHAGTEIFKQIEPNKPYKINDEAIDWGDIDSKNFIFRLIEKGLFFPILDGREVI